ACFFGCEIGHWSDTIAPPRTCPCSERGIFLEPFAPRDGGTLGPGRRRPRLQRRRGRAIAIRRNDGQGRRRTDQGREVLHRPPGPERPELARKDGLEPRPRDGAARL